MSQPNHETMITIDFTGIKRHQHTLRRFDCACGRHVEATCCGTWWCADCGSGYHVRLFTQAELDRMAAEGRPSSLPEIVRVGGARDEMGRGDR